MELSYFILERYTADDVISVLRSNPWCTKAATEANFCPSRCHYCQARGNQLVFYSHGIPDTRISVCCYLSP